MKKFGASPLHATFSTFGASSLVVELLLKYGADVNAHQSVSTLLCCYICAFDFFATPLHAACTGGHDEIAAMLLQAGAHVEGSPDV